ncbi:MAG: hypothetical protein PVI57_16650 [Gemmatimonadota bacterium]|jgi:hypothetical protein
MHATSARLRLTAALAVLAAAFAPPSDARGQTPGREPAVVEISASTRAAALGHAFQLGAPDADVIFYNPALVERAAGSMMGGVHVLGDGALGFTLSAARSWFGGGVGLGLQVLEYDAPGAGRRAGGLDPLVADGGSGTADLAASLAVARTLLGFRVGVVGKVVAQRFADFRQASGSLDVGLAHEVGPLTAGLSVRNLGPDRPLAPEGDVPQPRLVTLGVGGYGQQVGPLDLGLAAAVTLRDDEEVVVGGGLEIGYWPVIGRTFVFRAGARTVPEGDASPLTLGASYRGDELVLSWAWQGVDDLDGVHRFSVGWR